MRDRYKAPGDDPLIPASLRHAYQPPPAKEPLPQAIKTPEEVPKRRSKYPLRILLAVLALGALAGIFMLLPRSLNITQILPGSSWNNSPVSKQAQQPASQTSKPSSQTIQSVKSASFNTEPPAFTVYYPTSVPDGFSIDKSSITYSKDSFIFNVQQNGQAQFFINEQPAGTNFSYQRLKVRMGSPNEIDTPLGKGVFGTIGTNFVTAVNTNKYTLIIINCTALECGAPSKQLLGLMQINADPTHIRPAGT